MKSAVLVFAGVCRSIVRILLLAAALTVAESAGVSAQPSVSIQVQLVELDGWRTIKGPNDLHVYLCDRPDCAPNSRVSFLLYPGSAIAPGQLQRQRDTVAEMLQQRSAPCALFNAVLSLSAPRPMRCVATAPDGSKSYDTIGIVDGSNLSASLISSSRDETASETNYRQFEAALKAVVNSSPRPK
jgi:hypothetical protein